MKATRRKLLQEAVRHQASYRLKATVGRGCDRHLLAMMCASREMGMDLPKIFTDKVPGIIFYPYVQAQIILYI